MYGYVLSVISADHPGIVSAVSAAIEKLGGNILSCSQTVLSGYFTLIMIMELPKSEQPLELAEKIRFSDGLGKDYQIVVRATEEHKPRDGKPTDPYVITVFGGDRPGIIREFTKYLSGRDINIVDLFGEQAGEEFHLIGQLEIPQGIDTRLIQDDLESIGKDLGFTVRLQHKNIFTATNHLRFQ